ncbi:MAG: SDR family oxidoreductase [Gammaproteobacteria bacterium]|nr:SDR family oxidoreductase [Gammaproteobacteria bacterium]
MTLKNKVAIVTGGAGGMGRSTVMRFIEEGAKVVIADYNAASGAETLAEITGLGYKDAAHFIKTDVASEIDIKTMIECALDNFGRVDIMFNNAGVGGVVGPVWDLQVEEWDYTFDVLVKGVFLGIKHAAKVMRKQGDGGTIINTASVAGLSGGCGPLSYSAAKAAVINLTKAAAVQLAPDRIRVNAICPGFILTGLTHSKHESLEQAGKRMDATQPFPDHGKGEDIAGTALFLATEDSRFVNGEAIVVDGALTAVGPDMWQRWGVPYERDMTRNVVNKGTTGDKNTRRQLGD